MPEILAPEADSHALKAECDALRASSGLLMAQGRFEAYAFQAAQAPALMDELGRLRELSFRAAGEGTGKARDIDAYDAYYTQLALWDSRAGRLVGGYRMADAAAVLGERGPQGLYVNSLFELGPAILREMPGALELGRSFVRPEYQKDFLPLFMIWRGLGAYLASNPRFCRLFGCVSISPNFNPLTTQLLVSFLKQNSFDGSRAEAVTPRHASQVAEALAPDSMFQLQGLVSQIEAGRLKVPPLLRHYLKLGGRILAFNVDIDFNNTLDGLISVDLAASPPRLLEKYMGPEAAAAYLNYHRERMTT